MVAQGLIFCSQMAGTVKRQAVYWQAFCKLSKDVQPFSLSFSFAPVHEADTTVVQIRFAVSYINSLSNAFLWKSIWTLMTKYCKINLRLPYQAFCKLGFTGVIPPSISFNILQLIISVCKYDYVVIWNYASPSFSHSATCHLSSKNIPLTLAWMVLTLDAAVHFSSICYKTGSISSIIYSRPVQVLVLWQRKVKAFMNLNIFHINYVNIMINNQLHSLFKTCNVAVS